MRILARIVKPDVHAGLIEIFEMKQEDGKPMTFPVSIDGILYSFSKNAMGFWEPVDSERPVLADIRWYISGLISELLEKSGKHV